MWPWGHAAAGYLLYTLWARRRFHRPPAGAATLALAVGTQFPDLVDKPLAWTFGISPSGRAGAHSLLIAIPLLLMLWVGLPDRHRRSLWGAFAAGTIVASDGGQHRNGIVGETDATPTALSNLEEWRALALGNHGLLLIGSLTNTLDAETIQSAHILTATLEAALNHLKGRQQLAAQEDRLESQTRRIERLDRIARLTQQVEAAITDASTPGEIEKEICDRLANSGPYAFAWIGEYDEHRGLFDRHLRTEVVQPLVPVVDLVHLVDRDDRRDI